MNYVTLIGESPEDICLDELDDFLEYLLIKEILLGISRVFKCVNKVNHCLLLLFLQLDILLSV